MESKTEKLAQARKKLLNYQRRQQKSRTEASSPEPSVSNVYPNYSRPASSIQSAPSFNHDEKRSPFEWLHQPSQDPTSAEPSEGLRNEDHSEISTTSATASLENGAGVYHRDDESTSDVHLISADEFCRIKAALFEVTREKEKLSTQLLELHGHYSEIYAAYNTLIATVQGGGSGDSEMQTQLSQLRMAMSVIVEEKTALQQQLREANDLGAKRLGELELSSEALKDKTARAASLEQELIEIRKENERSAEVIRRQKEELSRNRKEAINLQASILHVQQDRNDAQERLKMSLKSAEQLQAELDETRKQLRLKDMCIRQLGANSATSAVHEHGIRNLHDENERLNTELARAKTEVDQYRKEAQAAREHYETYGGELNQKVLSLSNQLEETAREKMFLQNKLQTLEEESRVNRAELEVIERARPVMDEKANCGCIDNTIEEKFQEVERLEYELQMAKQRVQEVEATSFEYAKRNSQMEQELSTKVVELEHIKKDVLRMQTHLEEQQRASQDFCRLSSELQSEKATLSRAIAQNRELKEQLVELQNKMISLSTENMESESERLTALHTIERLNAELAELKSDSLEKITNSEVENTVAVQQHSKRFSDKEQNTEEISSFAIAAFNTITLDKENRQRMAEERIAQLTIEVDELRAENRRISQQNEELHRIMEQNAEDENQNNIHVELGQAIERISTLSTENESLRSLNQQLQKAANERQIEQATVQDNSSSLSSVLNGEINGEDRRKLQDCAPPSPLEKPLAWTELEARFARVMRQNAELMEQNELLEHVVLQLQSENDTIGEYVTIYHHQRKVIQERVRARDEAVAKLSLEKEQMKQKLNDLQLAVSRLFSSKGSLNKITRTLNGTTLQGHKHFSYNTVDELSGNMETMAKDSGQLNPELHRSSHSTDGMENGIVNQQPFTHKEGEITSTEDLGETVGEVLEEQILRLINELQDIEQARAHPPCAVNICCRECRGKLITL